MRHGPGALVSGLIAAVVACGESVAPDGGDPPATEFSVALTEVVGGLASPTYVTAPVGDDRLFIVEQAGRILIHRAGQILPTTFLDISTLVLSGGERGLLSVAFHPSYATNGFFFVNYTDQSGDTRVARYEVSADPDRADPQSQRIILTVVQPFGNHNGGLLLFGRDGMLYVGMGDGGSGGDPQGHGQDRSTLLGALLRIDVDGALPYEVPAGNPFVGDAGARDEIWAYGLRNPWRWTFDPVDRRLYVADVGQDQWEEINVVPDGLGGLNYGWNVAEGDHCFQSGCTRTGFVVPVVEYGHDEGCSVTGGMVYRGNAIPNLRGHYIYADFCRGWIRSFRYAGGSVSEQREWNVANPGNIVSFGVDGAGELYVVTSSGTVLRVIPG